MVRREGTRFGVSTGQCVRRPVRSQKTVHSSQNIIVEATTDVKVKRVQKQASSVVENHLQNRTLNLKGFGKETVLPFSLNKNKRWEVIDKLKTEAGSVFCEGNRLIVSEHHIGVGNPDENDCTAVYDSMSAKSKCSPNKTYARESDLRLKEPPIDETMTEDAEFGTKNRRRRQKKKLIVDKRTGIQEEAYAVSVNYSINVAAPKHTLYTYPKRGRSHTGGSDENIVQQITKQGTKKRSKKMSRDIMDDLVSVREYDVKEDYYNEDEDRYDARDPSIPRSEVTPVFGMFAVTADQQIAKRNSKRNNPSIQGSCTKERIFQIDKPDEVSRRGSSLDLEENSVVNLRMSADNLLPEILKGEFGEDYREAHCSPRGFAVDITDRVINKVTWKCECSVADTLLSAGYQVFAIFSVPTQEAGQHLDVSTTVVGERFNQMDAEKVIYAYQDEIECVTNAVEKIAKGLAYRVENRCPYRPDICHRIRGRHSKGNSRSTIIGDSLNWGIEIHSHRQIRKQVLGSGDEETNRRTMLCEGDICRVCYSEVSEMLPATCLQTCNHMFCDECWKGYLIAKVSQGDPHITCPEFNCKVPVDLVTVMSMVPCKLSSFHLQQKTNATVAANKHLQWCPSTGCGRVARVTDVTSNPVSIACTCGFDWCFKCKQEAHWPATCTQAATYRAEKASVLKYLRDNQLIVDEVRYKNCPKCGYPIEKISGCNNMICAACRCMFCWSCGGTREDGHNGYDCKPEDSIAFETFEFDIPSREHVYQLSVMHHFKGSKFNSTRRNLRANQLANRVVVAMALTHDRSCEESRRAPSFLSAESDEHIPKPVALSLLSSEEPALLQEIKDLFRGASDFLIEAYPILEFLEILIHSSPLCDLRKWMYQQKLRLEFIANQLDDILNLRSTDIKGCVERIKTLHGNGKTCMSSMAKAASQLSNMKEIPINVGNNEP